MVRVYVITDGYAAQDVAAELVCLAEERGGEVFSRLNGVRALFKYESEGVSFREAVLSNRLLKGKLAGLSFTNEEN